MITRAAFTRLSAAYITVNHGIHIQKLYNTRQHTMTILPEHAVQPKIIRGAEQWAKQLEKLGEMPASEQCSVTIGVQDLH